MCDSLPGLPLAHVLDKIIIGGLIQDLRAYFWVERSACVWENLFWDDLQTSYFTLTHWLILWRL